MSKKILVIDDEPEIRTLVKSRLVANGFDVATAEDGEQGLKAVESEQPDLIIVDIGMPNMDGYSFVVEAKKINDVPIIVLTAKGNMEDIFKMEGVKDYIVKPFDVSDLLIKVKKHVA